MKLKDSLLRSIAFAINVVNQQLVKNKSKGIQPSHTQVNKDDPSRPHFTIAQKLAIHVDKNLTPIMIAIWKNPNDQKKKEELFRKTDEYLQHPKKNSDWWEQII